MQEQQQQQQGEIQNTQEQSLWEFYGKTQEEYKRILETPLEELSYERGTEKDHQASIQIEKYFQEEFINQEHIKIKQQVFKELEKIVQEWSDKICREKNYVKELLHKYRARLLPFGSYCLGVSSNDGDIDCVIVAPHFIERNKHFKIDLLELIKSKTLATKVQFIDSSLNPIITFYYDGQAVDISLGKLDTETIPDDIDQNIADKHFISIENLDQRALNGRRNNMDCLKSVGNQVETYRSALKAIKIWYKSQGLNTNRLGYFGGIDAAILVAKICQLFPNLPLNRILVEFFRIYSQWDWVNVPVKIQPFNNDIQNQDSKAAKNFVKDPTKNTYMQILSPAYPCINTIKATSCNAQVIDLILKNTRDIILNEIMPSENPDWLKIFSPYKFFDQYKKFVEIDILGGEDVETFSKWNDVCEVKMLRLFQNFEENGQFFYHPFPKAFKKYDLDTDHENCRSYFIGIKKKKKEGQEKSTKKLSLKKIFKEQFVSVIYQELIKKRSENPPYYDRCDVRIFQTEISKMGDVELGKHCPEGFEQTKNSTLGPNLEKWHEKQQQLSEQNNLNQKRRGYSLDEIASDPKKQQRTSYEQPELIKQPSETDYNNADEFL